jgi:hypothetical protein
MQQSEATERGKTWMKPVQGGRILFHGKQGEVRLWRIKQLAKCVAAKELIRY